MFCTLWVQRTGAVNFAIKLLAAGAKRALKLKVGGAFHSPLMEPARTELAAAIEATTINKPSCPVYQNVSTKAETCPETIKANLIAQLTAPVRWPLISLAFKIFSNHHRI